jgi:hypothetical protein
MRYVNENLTKIGFHMTFDPRCMANFCDSTQRSTGPRGGSLHGRPARSHTDVIGEAVGEMSGRSHSGSDLLSRRHSVEVPETMQRMQNVVVGSCVIISGRIRPNCPILSQNRPQI